MHQMIQHGTVDLYQTCPLPRAKRVIFFNENEHGHAGYIALKALVGETQPTGRIASHLLATIAYNQSKEPARIGWEVYYADDTYLVNINEWPATPLFPIEESKATWIYAYPVVRDTIKLLARRGVSSVTFIASTAVHEVLDESEFPALEHDELRVIKFDSGIPAMPDEDGVFFTPPSWLFPEIASMMGLDAETIMIGYDDETTADLKLGLSIAEYVKEEYTLEYISPESARKAADEMADFNTRAEKIKTEMEELVKEKPANNTMWG